ncbi:MAG TPA: competence type IV pilus ATPase ComGA [Virgibacillus sp.]|nr:competence type IV pilus ATPase ComGA [Virgibacillus sp.]
MTPASSLSQNILQEAYRASASDIHFFPYANQTSIYFRVLGERIFHRNITYSEYQLLLTYYKFTSGMDIGEIRKPQNGIISEIIDHMNVSVRLSTLPVYHMESLAIRILPQNESDSLDSLFLFDVQRRHIQKFLNYRNGIILLTGPTGSGKTTTLYALLRDVVSHKSLQAITLEDPVEKELADILQVEVNERAGITYHTGLKAALRHDPDLIMVGEIRDRKTAQFAFEAALTGHLIISTIHAKNTFETIPRLLDLGVNKEYIHQTLVTVMALELLPIIQHEHINRRAAIVELLEGDILKQWIQGKNVSHQHHNQSFHHLRKKAYAYGFIADQSYFS